MELSCPAGIYQCSPSQWGIVEWGAIGIGVYVIASAYDDAKAFGPKIKKRAGSAATSVTSGIGSLTLLAAAGAGLYFWSQSSSSSTLTSGS